MLKEKIMADLRQAVSDKLEAFLTGQLPQEGIYEWALSEVCKEDYEKTTQADLLLKETMQAILDINHDNVKLRPDRSDLTYCLNCLKGKEGFEPLEKRIKQRQAEERRKGRDPESIKKILKMCRVYTVLFGICSLAVNIFALFKPQVFRLSFAGLSGTNTFIEVAANIIYAVTILWPAEKIGRGKFFYLSALILSLGFIYYWWASLSIVLKLSLHPLMIFVVAPFSGFPATLGLALLLKRK